MEKKPEVIEAIEILLEHDTTGDPITGIRRTHKTPAGIAGLLRQLEIEISANTVARLLHGMDFSLRVNRKASSASIPKRELVGNFKNNGVKWDRTPVRVSDHDFRSDAIGVAIPMASMT